MLGKQGAGGVKRTDNRGQKTVERQNTGARSGKLKVCSPRPISYLGSKKPCLIFKLLFSDSSLASINNYKIARDIFRLDIIHGVKKKSGGISDF